MKKRSFIYALGILLCYMQVGCLDDSYTGTVYVTETEEVGILHEVRMTIGETKELKSERETKGSGIIGSVSDLAGKDFYVYAFNKESHTDYRTLNVEDSLRCLIDYTHDDPRSLMGKKAHWNPNTETVEWSFEDSPIYYPMGPNQGQDYDFFAYYLDNIVPENEDIERNETNIIINVEIDGSQDLMSAKAKPTAAQLEQIKDERERLYQKEHCYSYYTASHNLNPNFDFIHHLTKLDFKLVPGGTPGLTKDVIVKKIEVLSKCKAAFTVADKYDENKLGLEFGDEKKRMELKEPDGGDFIPRLIKTVDKIGQGEDGIIDDLGSLMVAPDEEYYLYIVLGEKLGDIDIDDNENEIHVYQGLPNKKIMFSAGYEYVITLTIYGQMDIRVDADINIWDEGGYDMPSTEIIPGQ